MLLTDQFVFIHQPKTGGTFVTEMLEKILGKRKSARGGPALVNTEKHGTCDDIPEGHRGLPILSVFRSPWSRYVSQYHFSWWKDKVPPRIDLAAVKRDYPRFPEVSFREYVVMVNRHFVPQGAEAPRTSEPLGFNSHQFVRFYFRDAAAVWKGLDDASLRDGSFRKDMHGVRFLRQDHLNEDLHAALADLGFDRREIAFIPGHGKVLPHAPRAAKRPDRPWWEMWPDDLAADLRKRERLIWSIFPEAEGELDRARAAGK